MRIVLFDTETTGLLFPELAPLEKQPKIIELGLIVVEGKTIVEEHDWLIDPCEDVPEEITKITGITTADVAGKPTFGQLLGEIEDAFAGADICIAHNAPFDVGMMKNELARIGRTGFPWPAEIICSVQEYVPVYGKRIKLSDLYEKVIGQKLHQTHRALDDVLALHAALEKDGFYEKL